MTDELIKLQKEYEELAAFRNAVHALETAAKGKSYLLRDADGNLLSFEEMLTAATERMGLIRRLAQEEVAQKE